MGSTDTILKEKAGKYDAFMGFIKNPIVAILLAGTIGGSASTGIIAAATPNIPVPEGVAKEAALNELRGELKAAIQALQQSQAVYQAETNANMRALANQVSDLRQDFRDYKKDGK